MTAALARVVGAAAAAAALGCASMGSPPGGPEDETPPVITSVTPDSGAVNVRASGVTFHFDEPISDRGERSTLDALVLISPRDGAPRISWRREAVVVRPRRGFRPNTTYSVTLLPGVADLRGNQSRSTRSIVFSTGPEIATRVIAGRLWDWPAERIATGAIVEATAKADSTVYVTASDSAGTFTVGPLPAGEYRLRAFADANRNRGLDRGESWDSVSVATGTAQRTVAELYLAPRDSLPPRVMTVATIDSLHLNVELDRAASPTQPVTAANFRLRRSDSTEVAIRLAQTRREFDRVVEEARRLADTAALRRDSLARRDSIARADSLARAGVAPPAAAPARPTRPEPPRPSRPAPPTTFVLTIAEPLKPGATYRLYITGIRGLTGLARDSDRSFTVPAQATRAPADTARRAPADTARRTPPAPAPATRRP